MTIHVTDPEVPRALPLARLYLDDIEQIVSVLSSAERKASHGGPGTHDPPKPTFQVGNRFTCEIEDLRKITKSTRDFTLRLDRPGLELVLQLDTRGLHWWSSGLTRADAWETFHKLEAIIEPKAPRSETAFMATSLLVAATGIVSIFLFLPKLSPKRADPLAFVSVPVGIATLSVTFVSLFMLIERFLVPRTTVILRYSYDEAARREERNSKLLFSILGLVLGVAGTLLIQYLSRLIWPSH